VSAPPLCSLTFSTRACRFSEPTSSITAVTRPPRRSHSSSLSLLRPSLCTSAFCSIIWSSSAFVMPVPRFPRPSAMPSAPSSRAEDARKEGRAAAAMRFSGDWVGRSAGRCGDGATRAKRSCALRPAEGLVRPALARAAASSRATECIVSGTTSSPSSESSESSAESVFFCFSSAASLSCCSFSCRVR
jgi:hypothetical protein